MSMVSARCLLSPPTFLSPSVSGELIPVKRSHPRNALQRDLAMDAAACIGCSACVAACANAAANLFVGAKISHLSHLPQGQPERDRRALSMVRQMNAEGFANCTNIGEGEAACLKEIQIEVIARANHDYLKALLTDRRLDSVARGKSGESL